jgi:hypothetical protein
MPTKIAHCEKNSLFIADPKDNSKPRTFDKVQGKVDSKG